MGLGLASAFALPSALGSALGFFFAFTGFSPAFACFSAAGRASATPSQMQRIAGAMATRTKQPDSEIPLTQRETQVLRHLALGLSNKEISQSLSISIETVKEHVQHLLRKMGVNDRTQAAVWAVRKGMV